MVCVAWAHGLRVRGGVLLGWWGWGRLHNRRDVVRSDGKSEQQGTHSGRPPTQAQGQLPASSAHAPRLSTSELGNLCYVACSQQPHRGCQSFSVNPDRWLLPRSSG